MSVKVQVVKLAGNATKSASVIATGVTGGGYVSFGGTVAFGTIEYVTDSYQYTSIPAWTKIYLNEGEELYGRPISTYGNEYTTFTIIYHNPDPTPKNPASSPLSFTGMINLSQN
jgi:hypothetical protein